MNEERGRPQNAFIRHHGIYRPDVSSLLLPPGRFPLPGRAGAGVLGHAGKNMPCPSFAMSSGRLFLDGLLASIARLRFTDFISLNLLPIRMESNIIER